ncbi:MAG TPA: penicillin-binding transpeptidase domain-containing protein [Solirubrobacteraceae bacterium]
MARSNRVARVLALGALALVAGAAAVILFVRGAAPPAPSEALDPFVAAWSRGDDRGAAALTTAPAAAAAALAANRRGLDGARVQATTQDVAKQGDTARATLRLRWNVPGIGAWSYRTRVALERKDKHWKVAWAPTVVHPRLSAGRRLGTVRDPDARAPILDRRGQPLVTARQVVRIGLDRATVKDIDASAAALAGVLHVDGNALASAAKRAGPKQFVEAVTLRASDYPSTLAQQVEAIQGAQAVPSTQQLAPSKSFARALLGTVGPATAEQIQRSKGKVGVGDDVGQFGLEARYQDQLAGTPTRRIVIRSRTGAPVATLLSRPGRKGRELRTTLDRPVQAAAESALGATPKKSALVVLQPSTGDILAVANRPTDAAYDRAIDGRYAPGSTFKVVTTAALLRAGLKTTDTVDCPKTITVEGKVFKNFEGEAAGAVPFARDFAQSCNTAFVSLAKRLAPDALTRTARDFGLGRTSASQVPAGRTAVERAATMIGQDRIVASPLAMAGVAATVADGRWRAPRLVATDRHQAGPALDQDELSTLRALMRSVVTSGTGTALAPVPGEVAGKSGTAEYGGGNPPPTHAWFIAFRGDLAVAVLVENGRSGGSVAAPIAARFFQALGAAQTTATAPPP